MNRPDRQHRLCQQQSSVAAATALRYARVAALAGSLLFDAGAAAQGVPDWKSDTLSGDWSGSRTRLQQEGMTWETLYTGDILANISGGAPRDRTYMGNLDVKILLDLQRFSGWTDSRALVHAIANHGGMHNRSVGSFMGVDNIEVETNTAKLLQAWVERRFGREQLSLLFGLYAVDSEFNVNEASDVFLHPAFGTTPELAQTGRNGPSIFPTTSAGVRVRLKPNPASYVQLALLDGVPGDPDDAHGTHVKFERGDGTLLIAEAGFSPSQAEQLLQSQRRRRTVQLPGVPRFEQRARPVSKVAVGYWRYSAQLMTCSTLTPPETRCAAGRTALMCWRKKRSSRKRADPARGWPPS